MHLAGARSFSSTTDMQPVADTYCFQNVFSLHVLISSLPLRYSNNLGPLTTKAKYFLFIVFCLYRLAFKSRSHSLHLRPSHSGPSQFPATLWLAFEDFLSHACLIHFDNTPQKLQHFPYNIDCETWFPQFFVSYGSPNHLKKNRLPRIWHNVFLL